MTLPVGLRWKDKPAEILQRSAVRRSAAAASATAKPDKLTLLSNGSPMSAFRFSVHTVLLAAAISSANSSESLPDANQRPSPAERWLEPAKSTGTSGKAGPETVDQSL
jgi:hypothetical protein